MSHSTAKPLSWSRDNFLISTSPDLIQPQAVKAAFDSDFMYWTKPMSEEGFATMIANSLCFGVYETITATSSPAAEQTDSGMSHILCSSQCNQSLFRLVVEAPHLISIANKYRLPSPSHREAGWLFSARYRSRDHGLSDRRIHPARVPRERAQHLDASLPAGDAR